MKIIRFGITSIAIYSDSDISSAHALKADKAIALNGLSSQDTYMNIKKIIAIAKELGVASIHPGYGFLSENYKFAEAVEQAGICFIGPSSQAIKLMSSKIDSKILMSKANVPIVPWYDIAPVSNGNKTRDDEILYKANLIGYPILLKADQGGGGKGMRIVQGASDLKDYIISAQSESAKSFGSSKVIA